MAIKKGYTLNAMSIYVDLNGENVLVGTVQSVSLTRTDNNLLIGEAGSFNKSGYSVGGRTWEGSFESMDITGVDKFKLLGLDDDEENPVFNLVGVTNSGNKIIAEDCMLKGFTFAAALDDHAKLTYPFDCLRVKA